MTTHAEAVELFETGMRYRADGRLKRAIECWEAAAASGDPNVYPVAALNLGLARAEAGDAPGAEAALKVACDSQHPDMRPKAWLNLGSLYGTAGRDGDARTCFEIALASNHPEVVDLARQNLDLLG
jgi:tetratricopeptide (TPR) repeat protein